MTTTAAPMTGLTITDLFCGAGGSGLGAHAAGFRLVMAANHWQQAIETHAANFPDADHDCADISQVDPRRYAPTDVLWASPECTNHSQAKGKKRPQAGADLFGETLPDEAEERSRATMWDVVRFAESMVMRARPYRAIVVENVVEATKWIPFPSWLQAMDLLGYAHKLVSLNSMHAPAMRTPRAPQSRDRLYVVFWRKGQRAPDVEPRPLAWCAHCNDSVVARQAWKPGRTVGKYRAQYVYHCPQGHTVEPYALPAAAAIDWTVPGMRIGDRPKPLSPKTMARIDAGLRKYASRPFVVDRRFEYRIRDLDAPMSTLTANDTTKALIVPVEGRDGKQAVPVVAPMRTMSTRAETALVVPYYGSSMTAQPATRPMPTQGTVDTNGIAFIAELRGGGSETRSVEEPLCTVTASGNHHMLVRHNSSKGDGGEMRTPASEPARTITTTGHQSIVSIVPNIDDATSRMLEVSEVQAAMAFRPTYRVLGNRRERVRQLGNGVTPPSSEFLLTAIAVSLDAPVAAVA